MARYQYRSALRDGSGNSLTSVTISIYEAGGSTPADVYEAATGGSAVNSVDTDSNGEFLFWVDTADYDVDQLFKLSFNPGTGVQTRDNVQVFKEIAYKYLLEQAAAPSTDAEETVLYAKDVSSVVELFFRYESDGTEIQITDNGSVAGGGGGGSSTATRLYLHNNYGGF